jgi:hypothetical protein
MIIIISKLTALANLTRNFMLKIIYPTVGLVIARKMANSASSSVALTLTIKKIAPEELSILNLIEPPIMTVLKVHLINF